jgi:plasmid stabilization system protein ParE
MDVVWLLRATEQLLSIIDSVGEDNPSAAIDLALTIRAAADTLATGPNRHRAGRITGMRELVVEPNYIAVIASPSASRSCACGTHASKIDDFDLHPLHPAPHVLSKKSYAVFKTLTFRRFAEKMLTHPIRHPHQLGDMTLFDALGFQWDRSAVPADVPTYPVQHVCLHFHQNLAEFVWDAGVLEGNPFTLPAVKALLAGVTVSDQSASDQEQILALAESSERLLALVRAGAFSLSKAIFVELHRIVACNEALEWGVFRGEG